MGVVFEGGAGDVSEAFVGASDGSAEWVGGPCGAPEEVFDLLGWLFAVHGDFLADDLAFAFDVGGEEAGVAVEVEEDVGEAWEAFGGAADEEAGVVFAGVGVHGAADAFDVAVELTCGAAFGAFEDHVFCEVGETAHGGGVVAAADAGPDAEADAFHPRHFSDAEDAAGAEFGEAVLGYGSRAAADSRSPGRVIFRLGERFSTSHTGISERVAAETSSVTRVPFWRTF